MKPHRLKFILSWSFYSTPTSGDGNSCWKTFFICSTWRSSSFSKFLINFKDRLILQLDHYLLVEKPNFYVGFARLQLLFNWPLSIAALYAFAAGKTTWFTATCLPLAVSLFTCLVAILAELLGSGRASHKLLLVYFTFLSCAVLVILRGLLLLYSSGHTTTTSGAKSLALNQTKRA